MFDFESSKEMTLKCVHCQMIEEQTTHKCKQIGFTFALNLLQ